MKLPSFPGRSDAPTVPGGSAGCQPGSAELPQPLPSAPCWLTTASHCPDLTQPSFLRGPSPKPRPRQQDPAHPRGHQPQKRPKHHHQDPRTIVTLMGNSQKDGTMGRKILGTPKMN
ncbi:X-ray repair complementing defective repair in Chinese hamster cells 1, isoform CRA_c [Rattus norvegicus]|uniref:X-ray repair complementing defective repair in Chinese hamster cells 1, isoform CRA_c n=1 Tax=Rattus norvegicus TaxID=10116 RepID=A6J900_RAT|nr:X-ray repair complementing defective repair in Chinese hamster cells 1, isoform CRA_c [Rattus norvegicus]